MQLRSLASFVLLLVLASGCASKGPGTVGIGGGPRDPADSGLDTDGGQHAGPSDAGVDASDAGGHHTAADASSDQDAGTDAGQLPASGCTQFDPGKVYLTGNDGSSPILDFDAPGAPCLSLSGDDYPQTAIDADGRVIWLHRTTNHVFKYVPEVRYYSNEQDWWYVPYGIDNDEPIDTPDCFVGENSLGVAGFLLSPDGDMAYKCLNASIPGWRDENGVMPYDFLIALGYNHTKLVGSDDPGSPAPIVVDAAGNATQVTGLTALPPYGYRLAGRVRVDGFWWVQPNTADDAVELWHRPRWYRDQGRHLRRGARRLHDNQRQCAGFRRQPLPGRQRRHGPLREHRDEASADAWHIDDHLHRCEPARDQPLGDATHRTRESRHALHRPLMPSQQGAQRRVPPRALLDYGFVSVTGADEYVIETLPQCISADSPNRFPEPIVADVYLRQRLREIGLL
jgi:hypothetical protein